MIRLQVRACVRQGTVDHAVTSACLATTATPTAVRAVAVRSEALPKSAMPLGSALASSTLWARLVSSAVLATTNTRSASVS